MLRLPRPGSPSTRATRRAVALALAAAVAATPCAAQSLRGSRASIERMYRQAVAHDFSFFETPASVRRAVAAGLLVPLESGDAYLVHRVGYPWVRPATRTFVERLGAQYRAACGDTLVVTSAVRPATRQPANSTDLSVHPTGMAVDLRKPQVPACLRWLRTALLGLERQGVLEATEERAPAHFHVAIFARPYTRYVDGRTGDDDAGTPSLATKARAPRDTPAAPAKGGATYRVRPGDTLWAIARRHDTTVDAITEANGLRGTVVRPGQRLVIP